MSVTANRGQRSSRSLPASPRPTATAPVSRTYATIPEAARLPDQHPGGASPSATAASGALDGVRPGAAEDECQSEPPGVGVGKLAGPAPDDRVWHEPEPFLRRSDAELVVALYTQAEVPSAERLPVAPEAPVWLPRVALLTLAELGQAVQRAQREELPPPLQLEVA